MRAIGSFKPIGGGRFRVGRERLAFVQAGRKAQSVAPASLAVGAHFGALGDNQRVAHNLAAHNLVEAHIVGCIVMEG